MAQVAWPGVQPSSFGGGEVSAAQEPQPEPEATQEDDPEVDPEAILDIPEPDMPEVNLETDPTTQEDTAEATPKMTPQASPMTTPVLEFSTPQASPVMTLELELSEEEDDATAMDYAPSAPQDL